MSDHTPGPWTVGGPNISTIAAGWPIIIGPDGFTIAAVYNSRCPDADARLIAAAPDLLKALRLAADHMGEMDCGPLDEARAAIAKAGGRA